MNSTLTILKSFSALKFSGAKSQEFLQGQLTCDMRLLKSDGDYSLAACCDHRGRMIANFWVMKWQDDYFFILPHSMTKIVSDHLQKYAVFSKVIISESDALEKNILPHIKIETDETSWKKNNIENDFCILYPETSLLFTPQMISLEKFGGVSFEKGCYVGQEIVARTHYLGTLKRHLQQRTIHTSHAIAPGSELKNESAEVIGIVVECVKTDENEYRVLAVIQDRAINENVL